jgi:hypothetical protein
MLFAQARERLASDGCMYVLFSTDSGHRIFVNSNSSRRRPEKIRRSGYGWAQRTDVTCHSSALRSVQSSVAKYMVKR